MAIGLNDLEPSVGTAFEESIRDITITTASRATEDQKRLIAAMSKHRWLGNRWTSLVPSGIAYGCVMVGAQLSSQPWMAAGLFGLSFALSGASLWHTLRKDLLVGFRTHLPSEVLLSALPVMRLTPTASVYVETVAILVSLQAKVAEQTARNVLLRLNELLVSSRQLETQRDRLTQVLQDHPEDAEELDRARLLQQLQETDDSVVQQSIQQSLRMWESRRQDIQVMRQNLQRVVAQLEAIQQTFASTKSSLIRMQTASALASPAVEEIAQTVMQINQQSQAMEAAVEEVANLSASG